MRRFHLYAESQRYIWDKARELAEEYDLGEPIDVIVDALDFYEKDLKEKARLVRAP